MKKFIIGLTILFCSSFAFTKNFISLEVSPLNLSVQDLKNDTYIVDYQIKFGVEYNYVFDSNFLIGASVSIAPDFIILPDDYAILTTAGFCMNLTPIMLGYKFGNNHFFALDLIPITLSGTLVNGKADITTKDYRDKLVTVSVPISGIKTVFYSGIKADVQFGNNLFRNGFYVGIFIPWLLELDFVTIGNIPLDSMTFNTLGCVFELGYKFSIGL